MPDHFYVYPAYLARGRSRGEGRRVPATVSIPDLTADEIVAAATHLGFKAEVEGEKQFPRDVPAYSGRVKVRKKGGTTKAGFLRQLATELARRRAAGGKK
jgi:signal recognition particle subunit SRP19